MSQQTETVQRFEPSLIATLRELPVAERDTLIVLINNHTRELSAQSIQRLLPEKQSLAATRAILQDLVQRELVVKYLAQSWAGRFSVAPDVMKLVRE